MSNNPNEGNISISEYLEYIGQNRFEFQYSKPNKTPLIIELDHHTLFHVTDYDLHAYGSVFANQDSNALEIDDICVSIQFYNANWDMLCETEIDTHGDSEDLKAINKMLGFDLCKRILKDFEDD